ncbi:MAG: molybdopterin-dependent oxidoreductase [Pseudomonadota bacterium]
MRLLTAICILWAALGPNARADFALVYPGPDGVQQETVLTLADLAALPQATLRTGNDFVDGSRDFRGPRAADVVALLDGLPAAVDEAFLTAANDYTTTVPLSDFARFGVILAMQMDGAPLSRRDKGPIWLIYPIDDFDELRDPSINNRLIWQLVRMELR